MEGGEGRREGRERRRGGKEGGEGGGGEGGDSSTNLTPHKSWSGGCHFFLLLAQLLCTHRVSSTASLSMLFQKSSSSDTSLSIGHA